MKTPEDKERYPLLKKAIAEGRIKKMETPKREPRCGPWDERGDGAYICRKCGEVDWPGGGPFGY